MPCCGLFERWRQYGQTNALIPPSELQKSLLLSDIHKEIYAKMYISNIEAVIEGEIFPWPEFKYEVVFMETFRLHIRGLANEKGLNYFQEKILNY